MDLLTVAKFLPYLLSAYDTVSGLITSAKSNEDIVTKIGTLSPRISQFVSWLGQTLFPGVNPQLQNAAAAISIFGQDFVKSSQMTLNIVSPLLGLPAPNLDVDGVVGPLTQAATKAVQEALKGKNWKDLVVDGFYGFKTRDAINAFLATVAK